MCGRYYLPSDEEIEEYRQILADLNKLNDPKAHVPFKAHGEIFPTDVVPIIVNNKKLSPIPFPMKWGFTAPWDKKKQVINARSETAAQKGMFKDGMIQRRCLVPAAHYFEWQKTPEGKIKHAIKPKGADLLYMAGIYRFEHDLPVFTILTRDPAPEIAFIHNRMPVILPKEAQADWLNKDYEAEEIIKAALLDMEYKTA